MPPRCWGAAGGVGGAGPHWAGPAWRAGRPPAAEVPPGSAAARLARGSRGGYAEARLPAAVPSPASPLQFAGAPLSRRRPGAWQPLPSALWRGRWRWRREAPEERAGPGRGGRRLFLSCPGYAGSSGSWDPRLAWLLRVTWGAALGASGTGGLEPSGAAGCGLGAARGREALPRAAVIPSISIFFLLFPLSAQARYFTQLTLQGPFMPRST